MREVGSAVLAPDASGLRRDYGVLLATAWPEPERGATDQPDSAFLSLGNRIGCDSHGTGSTDIVRHDHARVVPPRGNRTSSVESRCSGGGSCFMPLYDY